MNPIETNFNLKNIRNNLLDELQNNVHPSFKLTDNEPVMGLWRFGAEGLAKTVELTALSNGNILLSLHRENVESYFYLDTYDDDKEGCTLDELNKAVPDVKEFLRSGKVNEERFKKEEGRVSDWPKDHKVS